MNRTCMHAMAQNIRAVWSWPHEPLCGCHTAQCQQARSILEHSCYGQSHCLTHACIHAGGASAAAGTGGAFTNIGNLNGYSSGSSGASAGSVGSASGRPYRPSSSAAASAAASSASSAAAAAASAATAAAAAASAAGHNNIPSGMTSLQMHDVSDFKE